VAELHEVGEAQARQVVAERPGGSRKVRKLRVGGREDQDVGRLLAEVDRLRTVGDHAGLGLQEMHGALPSLVPVSRCLNR
jgi:hypothetical protein